MMEYKLSKCEGCQLSDSIITRGVFAKSHIIEQMFPIICLQKLEKHSPHLSQKRCIHKFLLMLNICQIKCILKIKMVSSLMEPLHQQYLKDMIQSSFAKIRHKIEQMFTIYLQNLEKLEHTPAA